MDKMLVFGLWYVFHIFVVGFLSYSGSVHAIHPQLRRSTSDARLPPLLFPSIPPVLEALKTGNETIPRVPIIKHNISVDTEVTDLLNSSTYRGAYDVDDVKGVGKKEKELKKSEIIKKQEDEKAKDLINRDKIKELGKKEKEPIDKNKTDVREVDIKRQEVDKSKGSKDVDVKPNVRQSKSHEENQTKGTKVSDLNPVAEEETHTIDENTSSSKAANGKGKTEGHEKTTKPKEEVVVDSKATGKDGPKSLPEERAKVFLPPESTAPVKLDSKLNLRNPSAMIEASTTDPKTSSMKQSEQSESSVSKILTVITVLSVALGAFAFAGVLIWRRIIRAPYHSRQMLVNEDDFSEASDLQHFHPV